MENNLTFFDASKYASTLKCTVQKTGKVGFSDFTQKKLELNDTMSIKIGIDGTKDNFKNLLMQIIRDVDQTAFKLNRGGNYYYINPKPLLDELGIDYKTKNILYEMVCVDEQKKIYKLVKKEGKVSSQE